MELDVVDRTILSHLRADCKTQIKDIAKELKMQAHSLKGAAANLSIENLAVAAQSLEQIGNEGDLSEGMSALARLESELTRLTEYLTRSEWKAGLAKLS